MSQLTITQADPDAIQRTELNEVLDRDFNPDTWKYLEKMLSIGAQFPAKINLETCLGYSSVDKIGVLTEEAIKKIRAFIKRNPTLEVGIISCIESVRKGSIDSIHVLDTIVNPYLSFMGRAGGNHPATSVNQIMIGGSLNKIKLFVEMPEIGD